MKNKFFRVIIVVLGLGFIVKLTGDFLHLLRANQQIKTAEEKVLKLEEKNRELSEKYQYFQSKEFIEEEARNKLNMAKPGETIVVLPPNLSEFMNHSRTKNEVSLPNWRKWWNLFF
jgi:cell division protein FtsB